MTALETATNLGKVFGEKREEVMRTTRRGAQAHVLAGFERAIVTLVGLALAGDWSTSDAEAFWLAYDSGESVLLDLPVLDLPAGIVRA